MTDKPEKPKSPAAVEAAADKLDAAYNQAKFAATFELARHTGTKAKELKPAQVKAVAEKIFTAAAGEMIADNTLGLPGRAERGGHRALEAKRRGEDGPRNPGMSAKRQQLLKALEGEAAGYLSGGVPSADELAALQRFYREAHPRTKDAAIAAVRDQGSAAPEQLNALRETLKADLASMKGAARGA